MAGISGHTFTWKIENASYCWMQKEDYLASPSFVVEELNNTSWFLRLHPRADGNKISLGLERNPDCNGPGYIAVNFQLGYLHESGEIKNIVQRLCVFKAGTYSGGCDVSRDEVFSEKKSDYICNNTLTVQCRMSKANDLFFQTAFKVARTTIKVEKRSGLLVIESFADKLTNEEEINVDFSYGLNKFMTATFYSLEDWDEICGFKLKYFNKDLKYILMKTFILNRNHTMINCCEFEEFGDFEESCNLTLPMNKKFLTAKENNFLHDGALYFHFQCSYTTGILLNEIEEAGVAYIPPSLHGHIASSNDNSTNELFASSLKSVFMQYDSFNVEIETSHKQFAAHIDILRANSPVFRSWIQDALVEEGKVLLECEDIDCVTMSRLLIFIYTGRFITKDLDYESCFSLYMVACRYQIINLRSECSNFFINNMSMHALPLLHFAEEYEDQDLVRFLQQYIANHRKDIFSVD